MKKNSIIAIIALVTVFFLQSCSKDSLEPSLPDELSVEINNIDELRFFMDGSYSRMAAFQYWGRNIIIGGEVRADNVFSNGNSGRFNTISEMTYTPNTGDVSDIMTYAYGAIGQTNIVINSGYEASLEEDPSLVSHIKGEAYAIRALAHFDLLRLFGQQHVSGQGGMSSLGISYATSYKGEELYVPRSSVEQTKQFIYDDLNTAISMMSASHNDGEKVRITTLAVHAIKSRVATYFQDYDIARSSSEVIIGQFPITPADNVVESWAMQTTSPSSIFELAQSEGDSNGINGIANIYRGNAYGDIQVLDAFPTDAEFGPDDVRNSEEMIAYDNNERLRNMGKYPSGAPYPDNIKVIRYEEIVLNYAEALLETNPSLALQHLNSIPENRNGTTYSVANLDNILKERRKELAFEGFRFDDLARTGRNIPNTNTNGHHGGVEYGSHVYSFPIPQREFNANPLTEQNYGY